MPVILTCYNAIDLHCGKSFPKFYGARDQAIPVCSPASGYFSSTRDRCVRVLRQDTLPAIAVNPSLIPDLIYGHSCQHGPRAGENAALSSLTAAEPVGITLTNLSVLKTNQGSGNGFDSGRPLPRTRLAAGRPSGVDSSRIRTTEDAELEEADH
jgi:hypothetical protein